MSLKGVGLGSSEDDRELHTQRLRSLEEIRAFLAGTLSPDFDVPSRKDAYGWIESSLRQLGYLRLGKADKGVIRDYLIKVSGFSRAQVMRLIGQYRTSGYVRDQRKRPANAFRRRYLESPRVSRRHLFLRGCLHEQINEVFTGSPRAGCPYGV